MADSLTRNRRIVLAARPQGAAGLDCFRLETAPLEAPRDGEVLLRTLWLSLDPYMRGRMSDAPSYAPPVAVGDVMCAETVARVERSRSPSYSEGDLVLARSGWQEFAVASDRALVKLPAHMESPSRALGVLGMPGFTAYVGLLDIGRPQAGETVVVGAATGAVGSVVGQIAKLKGCRVVGIAGGAAKCAYAVGESVSIDVSIVALTRLRRISRPPARTESTCTTRMSAGRFRAPRGRCSTRTGGCRFAASSPCTAALRPPGASRCMR